MILLNFCLANMTPWRVLARICILTDLGSTDRDSRSAFRSAKHKNCLLHITKKINSSWSGLWLLILYSLCDSALYQKSDLWLYSQKWNCALVQPRSQFLHWCICERFRYSQDRSFYLAAAKWADRSWVYINH